MRDMFKNRNGSITITAIYIFIIMISSTTMMLYFASLQSHLSKNQLEKIQSRYNSEGDLNKLLYYEENIDKYIKPEIFRHYRNSFRPDDGKYHIVLENGDKLKDTMGNVFFRIRNIDDKETIFLNLNSKHNNINTNIVAYGSCVKEIFELKRPFLNDNSESDLERELVLEFIGQIEEENWDYDAKIISKAEKININKNLAIKFLSEGKSNLLSGKALIHDDGNSKEFTSESMIIHLKRNSTVDNNITIGELNNNGLITMNGVLYIEGDLIINQDFEFLGLIIINKGEIIIKSKNKPIIQGMLISKEGIINEDLIDLLYDQKSIYKSASFLPGFLDIVIEVIKKY